MSYVVSFEQLRMTDVDSVGGKNASLGEMISQLADAGVRALTLLAVNESPDPYITKQD
jgi:phosphoenolpyruvate synthase/pyruvate phosphate dikinase